MSVGNVWACIISTFAENQRKPDHGEKLEWITQRAMSSVLCSKSLLKPPLRLRVQKVLTEKHLKRSAVLLHEADRSVPEHGIQAGQKQNGIKCVQASQEFMQLLRSRTAVIKIAIGNKSSWRWHLSHGWSQDSRLRHYVLATFPNSFFTAKAGIRILVPEPRCSFRVSAFS